MFYRKKNNSWFSVVTIVVLLSSAVVSSSVPDSTIIQQSEKCVLCHTQTFNQGINSANMHLPFWEGKCISCHVPENSTWFTKILSLSTEKITGSLVSQEPRWTKRKIYHGSEVLAVRHSVPQEGLEDSVPYRFRIVLSDDPAGLSDKTETDWLGLQLEEVPVLGSNDAPINIADRPDFGGGLILDIKLHRFQNTVFAAWQTSVPKYGWIELEKLEWLGIENGTAAAAEEDANQDHPPLHDPEVLTIDVCYSCHPAGGLGTSHPVRIYATGNDTVVPDTLPTVKGGMITCVTCHAPHGAPGKNLVREEIKTKLCVACHYNFKNKSRSTLFD